MELVISVCQFDVQRGEPEHNLDLASSLIVEAARRGSDLVVLPELWDTGYALEQAKQLGSPVEAGRFATAAGLGDWRHY